ncbi:hypothetical protein KCU88_g5967, partial [Aureobasidium melanogenum]
MSDFEDYAYSPYDDIEDILYDADPAPELADDLAEHAVHSPVYEGEVAGSELHDYFSDWEYYSDDYVDDDPALLRQNPQVGSPLKQPLNKRDDQNERPKRGRKRKLDETTDNQRPDARDVALISRCIKGTVWAKPNARGPPAYKEGQEGKVALMKNWRDVFAITDSGWGRSRRNTNDDESWAKDMSLADMGLESVPGQSFEGNGAERELESGDEAQQDEDIDDDRTKEDVTFESSKRALPMVSDGVDEEELPRKRTRLKSHHTPPARSVSPVAVETKDNSIKSRSSCAPGLPSTQSTDKLPDRNSTHEGQDSTVTAPTTNGLAAKGGRKRKAAEDSDVEEAGPLKSTASSRAKRVASTKSKSTPTAPAPSRQTRSSRK